VGSPRPLVRGLLALLVLGALFTAGPASANLDLPYFTVATIDQSPGAATDIGLDLTNLSAGPTVESVSITVPVGYVLARPPLGVHAGESYLAAKPAAGGDLQELVGRVLPELPAALAPELAPCAPGDHVAAWHLVLDGAASVSIPVAVDTLTSGGSYRLTACLDGVKAAGLVPEELDIFTTGLFTNPTTAGMVTWDALVTPFAADGTPDPTAVYELRADEPLPELVTARPSYDARTKTLAVRGVLTAAGRPRAQINVHVFGGRTPSGLKEIGVAVTAADGSYRLALRTAKPPAYIATYVHAYVYSCAEASPSSAPGGCTNETMDGVVGAVVKVPPAKPKPKPRKRKR
jgi:hypothetical protein